MQLINSLRYHGNILREGFSNYKAAWKGLNTISLRNKDKYGIILETGQLSLLNNWLRSQRFWFDSLRRRMFLRHLRIQTSSGVNPAALYSVYRRHCVLE